MKRWLFALAMAAMLAVGFAAGSVLTHARAEGTPVIPFERYRIITLQRFDKNDPLAIRYNTQNGATQVINANGAVQIIFNAD